MALKTKYSPLQHFSMDNLLTAFGDLPSRNKLIVLAMGGLVLILVLLLPMSLFSGRINSLQKEITASQRAFRQVNEKLAVYEKVKKDLSAIDRRFSGGGGGSLTSRIEAVARQSNLTVDQLTEKAPQETDFMEISSIEVKLSNISLSQLMEFLYNVENNKTSQMRIRRIQIKTKYANRQALDVTCEVATFALRKET